MTDQAMSPLRRRMIEDMTIRKFAPKTQHDYSMYMGVDVADGLDTAKSQSRIKNNVFATGFLNGAPASRGCSAKGKFWSISPVRDLADWVEWCADIGQAVNDPGITTDGVFKSAMRPRQISERPAVPPVAIHWPESLLTKIEDRIEINFENQPVSFIACDIELLDHQRAGPLRFAVRSDVHTAEFEIVFSEGGARYPQRSGPKTTIKVGGKVKTLSESSLTTQLACLSGDSRRCWPCCSHPEDPRIFVAAARDGDRDAGQEDRRATPQERRRRSTAAIVKVARAAVGLSTITDAN